MMMIYRIIMIVFLGLIIVPKGQAQETMFFDSLYDVPVMSGLSELPDMALSFDKMDGRISEAGALMQGLSREAVIGFYNQTLQELGWRRVQEGLYVREKDSLTISFERLGSLEIVKFLLKPAKN